MSDLGTCLSCVSDLTPDMRMVSGRMALAEAIARRLQTPRGRLIDDPNYGYALSEFIDADVSPADIARIQGNAQAECLKDQRVLAASVAVTFAAGLLIVTVGITDAAGPFSLVLSVSDVTTDLLKVTR